MTDLDILTASVNRLAGQLTRLEPDLASVKTRLHRLAGTVLVCGVTALVLGLVIILVLIGTRKTVESATGDALCPVIRILTSDDPPRTTDAGRAQEDRIRAVTRQPGYPC